MKTCPVCGSEMISRRGRKVFGETFRVGSVSVTFNNYVVYHCDSCGESIVDNKTISKVGKIMKAVKEAINEQA